MTAEQIAGIVRSDLADSEAAPFPPGPTVGIPWSDSKRQKSVSTLRASLVTPYAQRFRLKDTSGEMRASSPGIAVYWVIAQSEQFLEFYDPEMREYGLAMQDNDGTLPETIGVRGDLVGVFAAM